jgi:hypothetical protein
MADRILFIGWGTPVRGREERALEVFNDALGLYGRMQQDARIEAFDVVLLAPNRDLNGYFQLHGSAEQLAAVREDDEFQRVITAAGLIIDDLSVVDGYANEGVARQIGLFQEAVSQVPQSG